MVLSDIEGKAAQGSGDRAWEAKEFQSRKEKNFLIPTSYFLLSVVFFHTTSSLLRRSISASILPVAP